MTGPADSNPKVAIVDYGMGNLFSVRRACDMVGLEGVVTSDPQVVEMSEAVILPGVGAFGKAMQTLKERDLVDVLITVAASGRPFVGICLGAQLLMEKSYEYGCHQGLGLIRGEVRLLSASMSGAHRVKVPNIGWSPIRAVGEWEGSLLSGVENGSYMYFVHSFCMEPAESDVILATTEFGQGEFCSTLRQGSVFGCQYHPERSGEMGLLIYRNLARQLGVLNSE